jgi:hypothetical protein
MSNLDKVKTAVAITKVRPMSIQVAEVRQNINLIQEAMKATMKKEVHYGVIPGTNKPSLYKPGAEIIMALFKLSSDPIVTDLSRDNEIRYQVKVNITHRDGTFIGSGIGECSSKEEKFMWRAAICQEEFDATAENLRRIKFRKNKYNGLVDLIPQVRVEPSDMANTILKMAKKRALIDAVLTATGASDIFHQDLEDLPEGYIAPEQDQELPPKPEPPTEIGPAEPPTIANGDCITEPQRKRLFAIAIASGMTKEQFSPWLKEKFGYESSKLILKADYEKICNSVMKKQ